jgi:hypothetical protein
MCISPLSRARILWKKFSLNCGAGCAVAEEGYSTSIHSLFTSTATHCSSWALTKFCSLHGHVGQGVLEARQGNGREGARRAYPAWLLTKN